MDLKEIRILHILDSLDYGGVSAYIMNQYRNIDRAKVQFDFLTYKNNEKYLEEIQNLGGKIYTTSIGSKNKLTNFSFSVFQILKFLNNHNYQVIHVHNCSIFGMLKGTLPGKLSKKVKLVIGHSHNSGTATQSFFDNSIRIFLKEIITWSSDLYFACSHLAGLSKYPNRIIKSSKFEIMYNAIDEKKYVFNEVNRNIIREKFNIEDKTVIGHVGRMEHTKNHSFLLDIFYEIVKEKDDVCLLLIGNGSLQNKLIEKVRDYNIEDKVIFAGVFEDTNELYQAMDLFVFPSFYEGLGIVLIEAQLSGLSCFVSERVPEEANISKGYKVLNLRESAYYWAKSIMNSIGESKSRIDTCYQHYLTNYNIIEQSSKLQELYLVKAASLLEK